MKKFILVGGVLCLLVGCYFSLPMYRAWKQRHFVAQARAFFAKADYGNAALSARQALAIKADDIEAAIVLAQVFEKGHSPYAFDFWQKVVNLDPKSASNRIALARSALAVGNYQRADQALREIPPASQKNAAYQQFAGMVAMAENNIAKADWHFTQAAQLDPQNKSLEFNQAVIHLQARNPEAVAAAEKTLQSLVADPVLHKDALRLLVLHAVRKKDFAGAQAKSQQLTGEADASFQDRLMQLLILKESGNAGFASGLAELQARATKSPEQIYALVSWLAECGLSANALEWIARLPAEMQADQTVRMAHADTLVSRGDWPALESFLAEQHWGNFDFVRLAQLARAVSGQGRSSEATARWQEAVHAATEQVKSLTLLVRLADAWGWEREREELLWKIIGRYPAEHWTLQALNQIYTAQGNTHGLQKIYSTLIELDPNNLIAKNNLASVSLLLNYQLIHAHEMAAEAYAKYPGNPAFAATYAYDLHLQGRTGDGLKALEKLSPAQLQDPGIAVYYGVMLLADGQSEKAKTFLKLAGHGQLLPEEKALVDGALATLK